MNSLLMVQRFEDCLLRRKQLPTRYLHNQSYRASGTWPKAHDELSCLPVHEQTFSSLLPDKGTYIQMHNETINNGSNAYKYSLSVLQILYSEDEAQYCFGALSKRHGLVLSNLIILDLSTGTKFFNGNIILNLSRFLVNLEVSRKD